MDPQQELFIALKENIEAFGYDVYDGFLPPEGTPYPFVYIGDFSQSDSVTKGRETGYVYPTIHVWHNNPRKRGTVSNILCDIKRACIRLKETEHYRWIYASASQQIVPDNTTNTPLMHGVFQPEYKFT